MWMLLNQTTYKLDGLNGILAKWKKPIDESKIIDIEYIRQILERVTDSDCEISWDFLHQWCRPEWLICDCNACSSSLCKTICKTR